VHKSENLAPILFMRIRGSKTQNVACEPRDNKIQHA